MKTQFIAFLLILIFALSCKKETIETTTFIGEITITNPAANDTITGSQTIVTGNISGNMELHGYHLVLFRTSDHAILAEKEVTDHSTTLTINDTLNYGIGELTQVKLRIESAYNHEGDMTIKDVLFYLQP